MGRTQPEILQFACCTAPDGTETRCAVTKDCAHITDSWKICGKDEMTAAIAVMRAHCPCGEYSDWYINNATDTALTNEWAAHNLLYEANIAPSRTKDADLNKNKWHIRAAYALLAFIYHIIIGKN